MNKKILIIIIAIVIVIIAVVAISSFSKPDLKGEETNEPIPQRNEEVTSDDLEELMESTIKDLESTCADFLKGDLSGDPNFDCPGFDNPINRDLCFYCYAVKNQTVELCGKITNEPAFKILCQRATGASVDEIINQ